MGLTREELPRLTDGRISGSTYKRGKLVSISVRKDGRRFVLDVSEVREEGLV